MAFYRKWRPQSLAEVVGQEHVTRTLLNALTSGRVAHAYLFCGPRGTGKTSTGRILAKAVNCVKKTTGGKGEPCNKCAMCKAITEGRALDIIEIDAASNRGIDQMRELRERVSYAPAEAAYKVYIIDEVHMLTTEASNALLKTLEEPPPRVIFVLATTETHKVLPTIVSRCQRFDFKRLSQQDTEEKLGRIAQAEGINIAPEAMRQVARAARGGLRDAENLLEQLFTYYGADIALTQVQALLGTGGGESARQLVACLAKKDLAGGLKVISQAQAEGLDLRQFNRDLVHYLRQMMLIKSGAEKDADLAAEEMAELKALAQDAPLALILKSLKLFGEAQKELGEGSLALELALVDATMETPMERLANAAGAAPAPAATPQAAPAERPAPTPRPTPPPRPAESAAVNVPIKKTASEAPPAYKAAPKAAPAEPPPVSSVPGAVPLTGNRLEQLRNSWRQIIEQAPDNLKRTAAVAILRSAGVVPIAIDGGTVTLSFKHNFHKEKIEEVENRRVVTSLLGQFLGQTCQIKCIYEPAENHLVREAQKLGAQVTSIEDK